MSGLQFCNYIPLPGSGPVELNPHLGAVPFLLGGPPVMVTSPARGQPVKLAADYNRNRPRSALGIMAPARFAASWGRCETASHASSSLTA